MRIAVCEDEPIHRERLVSITKNIMDSIGTGYTISEFKNGEGLISSNEDFDIYFLDIKMDEMTGMEAAKKIRENNKKAGIIFVTALKDYVFEAFDINAFHYLIKPVEENKLKEVLESFLKYNSMKESFIIAKIADQSIKVSLNDIVYIESHLRKIAVHTKNSVIEYYYKLSDIEKELYNSTFFRCHKSYIVNLKYVDSYNSKFITLKNNENVYLSKHKYADFSKAFMYYLKSEE